MPRMLSEPPRAHRRQALRPPSPPPTSLSSVGPNAMHGTIYNDDIRPACSALQFVGTDGCNLLCRRRGGVELILQELLGQT